MHVFKYSPRKGTKAASFSNQVEGKTKILRSEKLIELSDANERRFASKYIGKSIDVLFENEEEGHTTNYIKVIDKNKLGKAKEIISVIPKGFESDYLYL